ncbi:MAG: hypothetical protein ABSH50_19075 [Bryobacteraceae bacterium]|jgi:hypothetical protein
MLLPIPIEQLRKHVPEGCALDDDLFVRGILNGFRDLRYRDGTLLVYPGEWHPAIPREHDPYRSGWLLGQWYRRLLSN